jgi:hypothetical protein
MNANIRKWNMAGGAQRTATHRHAPFRIDVMSLRLLLVAATIMDALIAFAFICVHSRTDCFPEPCIASGL